jgi:tetratricopeptide (TPR) repeat protein
MVNLATSSIAMNILWEPEKALTAKQELDLSRAAYARSGSPKLRRSLAELLLQEEMFDDIIDLLEPVDDLTFNEAAFLCLGYLSRETEADNLQALELAGSIFDTAGDPQQKAFALAHRGKAEVRLGLVDRARDSFEEALRIDPTNKDACKRLAALHLQSGQPAAALDMADRLLAKGADHARLFSAKALAEVRSGDLESARATAGMDTLFQSRMLSPPEGWDSLEAFNAALAEELLNHPCIRFGRYGSASELTWRVEAPLRRDTPNIRTLLSMIDASIREIADSLQSTDHPWVKAVPKDAFLRAWCVITESDGFESWHVHQFGWLSGVYYIRVPDSISKGSDNGGCLAFGLPEDLAGAEGSARFGEKLVRPQEGLMLAFPSHSYHRTYPHGSGEKRICFAFDLRPL